MVYRLNTHPLITQFPDSVYHFTLYR